ncbi:hypothetical protein [Endozoicomonas sp. GU-1]|nr:hypothetical protein [Endozoicomonas sp. GU-1]WBA81958.1 hypothetical protein O2T12_01965 [Endozoicomonas sp. GU-1]WBA84908.1 hypothetical protein O3276_16740 [Endozoicomonas sp. GU-1]
MTSRRELKVKVSDKALVKLKGTVKEPEFFKIVVERKAIHSP